MADPLVTVICPTYNRRTLLRCALRSVLNQDFSDFEVRVTGDGCTDGTEEVIAELNDARLHWFNLPKNTGSQSEPNNEGLRRARGKYIALIGHDDLWMPWHLSRLVKHIEAERADFAHDLLASIGLNGVENVYGPPHPRSGYGRVHFPPSCWLHRREFAEQIGFWRNPDEISLPIDYDYVRRAAEAGKKFTFLPSLGGLKFHSTTWKTYAPKDELPQEHWLESILKSPVQLNEQILTKLAALSAFHYQDNDKKPLNLAWHEAKAAGKTAAKSLIRELIYLYGQDRWPVGPLLRRRMKRIRSRQRPARGLPPP